MNDIQQTIKSLGIDPITLFVSIFSVFLTASFILWDVDLAKQFIGQTYSLIVDNFGSAYLVLTIFSFIF